MDYESYREQITQRTLFEAQNGQQLSGSILALGEGHVSPEGSTIYRMAMDGASVLSRYQPISDFLLTAFGGIAGIRPVINGWAVQNAVKAEGATAKIEEEEQKKGLSRFLP